MFRIFLGDPPEPEELIKAVLDLESSASSDANIRERIASLPPEVSEIALLGKLEDKESAIKLAAQVNNTFIIILYAFCIFFHFIIKKKQYRFMLCR